MKALRKSLSKEEIEYRSRKVCGFLFDMEFFKSSQIVCVYMNAFNEVATETVIKNCIMDNKKVVVPVVNGDEIFLSEFSDEQEKGAFGIFEPVKKKYFDPAMVDIFIVPGLAFDESGSRLGFGKGYYDKLLKNTKGKKIGFLYDFQLVNLVKKEPHDILMDYLITESRVINCDI